MRIIALAFLLGLCASLFGQNPTVNIQPESGKVSTIEEKKPFYYIEKREVHWIDTVSLDNIEDFGMQDFVINLGNDGSPSFSLKPELEDLITNDYSILSFQPSHNFRRFSVFTPIVDAKYVIGTGQEQHFSLLHSQNIKEKVNYTIGLNKINSKGIYLNQETSYTDIFFKNHGDDLFKGKYHYDIEFNFLNSSASLNGGLEDDSTFINDTLSFPNRQLFDVNLLNSYQEINKWYGSFGHRLELYSNADSVDKGCKLSIINRFQYENNTRLFYDTVLNIDFYDRILIDSSVTNESLTFQDLSGYIGFDFGIRKKNFTYFRGGVEASYVDYRQIALDTFRWDIEAQLEAVLNFNGLIVIPKASYLVNDYYDDNDYNLDMEMFYLFGKLELEGRIYFSNERPQLDMLQYSSNHVSWNNSFEKYQVQHFSLGADYKGKWDASLLVNYFDVHNPIYFGYDKTPYQAPGVAQLIRTSITTTNKGNKRWDLSGELHYQHLGGYNVFRLPNVLAKVSAAFKFKAFKKKMDAAIGADLTYFSKYETKHFDPVTGQYYIYSNGEVGNYPFMNVYLKSRVQRATFFLMMSHPHQGLFGYNYFYFPGYPANDRFFRIGVSWLFVN